MPLFSRAKDESAPAESGPESVYLPDPPAAADTGFRDAAKHRAYLVSLVDSLRPFGVGLMEAAGLTLCESLFADLDVPTYTSAVVDGWAVRASNLVGASAQRPIILPLAAVITADGSRGAPLTPGTAVWVQAGASVPEGADAVVPVDQGTLLDDEEVQFVTEAQFQQNMRLAGSRISDGDQLLTSGTVLTPRALGLIAEVGFDKVLARPRPRVVVLTADATVVEPGLPLTKLNQQYDSCTTLLSASLRADGAQVFSVGIVGDTEELGTVLTEQLVRADLVVLATRASDELVALLGQIGTVDVAEVDTLPGRQIFALVGAERVPLLVVSTEAVPAYLAYLQFGRPLLRQLRGLEPSGPRETGAPLTGPIEPDPVRTRLLLGRYSSRGVAALPAAEPGATELAEANAVIVAAPGTETLPAHSDVTCWLLD